MISSSRRSFLGSIGRASLAGLPLTAMFSAGCVRKPTTMRAQLRRPKLRPTRDETTGLPLLMLPEGFSYRSLGWSGTPLAGGFVTPSAHDGMGLVRQVGRQVTLIRNHEKLGDRGSFGPPELSYDPVAAAGCVAFEFDLDSGEVSGERCVLAGTVLNCAGGVTPWGTWLSGEEIVRTEGRTMAPMGPRMDLPGWTRDHGFLFEVHPDATRAAAPILAAGLFKHEAAAVHAETGIVYETEDNHPEAGFYRLLPNRPGQLAEGGRLQMLAVKGRRDLRRGLRVGQSFEVYWVDIADPTRGNTPGTRDGRGVFGQGYALGGAQFTRGEGLAIDGDILWFTCTNGGDAGRGQVFAMNVRENRLSLIWEAGSDALMDSPDNLTVSPNGSLLICEDNKTGRPQKLLSLNQQGELQTFCISNLDLREQAPAGVRADDYRWEEWAGVCFSPDGRWLFANLYEPGLTVAIRGPWAEVGL